MNMDTFSLIIHQMKNWGGPKLKVVKLSLYGEPLMNRDFCEMVRVVKDAGITERIETTSNVSLMGPDICEGIIRSGLDYIRVSIYSPLQDKHEAITGSSINIDDIHQNLKTLQEIKAKLNFRTPFVSVKMLDTYSSENDLFMAMYSDVADELYLDKPHNWVGGGEKNFIKSLYKENTGTAQDDLNEHSKDCRACSLSFYILSVRNNGDVSPCCNDWSGNTNVGNINETELRKIWQGPPMRNFWKMQLSGENFKNPSCKNCKIYKSSYYAKDNVDSFPLRDLKYP
jgi:radical SAM protein with 4Fe4S-binding SPASM domain